MEWFSFETECFRKPAIQFALPDLGVMGEEAQGKYVCAGKKSKVFKVDIVRNSVEILKAPKSPWADPFTRTSVVRGNVIYWLDPFAFELKAINFTAMKKTRTTLHYNIFV